MELSSLGIITAFLAGIVSFLSPCVLPLVPAYLSYVGGQSLHELDTRKPQRASTALQAIWFSFGFSTVFVLLGAGVTAASQLLMEHRQLINTASAILVISFGLFMTGLVKLSWLNRDVRFLHHMEQSSGPFFAYLLGVAFAFGWTPCIGPILGSILTLVASSQNQSGLTLLMVYSLGLAVPFILSAIFVDRFLQHHRTLKRWSRPIHIVTGTILILMGIGMLTGYTTRIATWLLETFPIFTKLG